MAEKQFILRLELENGQVVVKGLEDIGAKGDAAMKKVGDAARNNASPGMRVMSAATTEAQRAADQYASRLGPLGNVLRALGPGGLLAAAGIGAIGLALKAGFDRGKEAADRFDALADSAARLKTSAGDLVQWRSALELAGGSMDDFAAAAESFQGKIGNWFQGIGKNKGLAQAFDALGISREQLAAAGTLRERLLLIAEALSKVEGAASRAGLADKLGLRPMLPLLEQGRAGVTAMLDEFEKLGGIVDEGVRHTGDLGDRIKLIQQELQFKEDNLFVRLGPLIIGVYDQISGLIDKTRELLQLLGMVDRTGFERLQAEGEKWRQIWQDAENSMLGVGVTATGGAGVSPGVYTAETARANFYRVLNEIADQYPNGPASNMPWKPGLWPGQGDGGGGLADTGDDADNLRETADAQKEATAAARERESAERDLATMLGGVAKAEYELAEAIERINDLRAKGVVVTKAQEAAILAKAQAELMDARAAEHGQGKTVTGGTATSQYGAAADDADDLTQSITAADRAQIGLNASLDVFGQAMDGSVRSAEDLLDVLMDVLSQLIRIAAQQAAMGQGSFWSNLVELLGGAVGIGVGGAGTQTGSVSYSGPTGQQGGGFARGGYTGDGPPDEPAGTAHKGEYYFDQGPTRRIGVSALESLRRGDAIIVPKGMESARGVDSQSPLARAAAWASRPPQITVLPAPVVLPSALQRQAAERAAPTMQASSTPEIDFHVHNEGSAPLGVTRRETRQTAGGGFRADVWVKQKAAEAAADGSMDGVLSSRFGAAPKKRRAG